MADQQYKPTGKGNQHLLTSQETDWQTEHGGLKQDGTPDKRVGTGGMSTRFLKYATMIANMQSRICPGQGRSP
jgi:hypothetical protein